MPRNRHSRAQRWQVFINAPFNGKYQPLLKAMVFAVIDWGFIPRCSLEGLDSGQVRLDKLVKLIADCGLGIHDISCTELDPKNKLPRFNMPFELGLFIGAHRFGPKTKSCLILDRTEYRYQKFLSDISGQDPQSHDNNPKQIIVAIRNWLDRQSPAVRLPGGIDIHKRYSSFCGDYHRLCQELKLDHNFHFNDFCRIIKVWLKQVAPQAAETPEKGRWQTVNMIENGAIRQRKIYVKD